MRHAVILLCAVLVLRGADSHASNLSPGQSSSEMLPPLTGVSEKVARERLGRRGFHNVTAQSTSVDVKCPPNGDEGLAPGLVCGSIPSGREELSLATAVVLIVQGERSSDDPRGIPPKVLGMPLGEGVAVLARHRFTNLSYAFVVKPIVTDAVCSTYKICAVDAPGAGVMLPDGTWNGSRSPLREDPITIIVGTAFPERRLEGEMISIVGDTIDVALEKLDRIGIRGVIQRRRQACPQSTAQVPSGRICDQRPAAGTLSRGTAVEFVIAGDP